MGLNEAETFEWMRQRIADLERKLAAASWQPIETAPKSRTSVLVFVPDRPPRICSAMWLASRSGGDWWHGLSIITPTHWMPLPEPPADEDERPIEEEDIRAWT